MTASRTSDTNRLHQLLGELETRYGKRTLSAATARDGWPSRGLYFFFEPGETRADSSPRIVRVGTHALTAKNRTTLWRRLAQHRGHLAGSNPGSGNHRGSIFRLHVGAALLRRDNASPQLLASWLAHRPDPEWIDAEHEHERAVSRYIGHLPFLWLAVPNRPDETSDRGHLERNCIGLLSTATGGIDNASAAWLGSHAVNPAIRRSGLWNVNHVDDAYQPRFLDLLAEYVD